MRKIIDTCDVCGGEGYHKQEWIKEFKAGKQFSYRHVYLEQSSLWTLVINGNEKDICGSCCLFLNKAIGADFVNPTKEFKILIDFLIDDRV